MRIEVAGIPAPQGSKRHVGGGRMVEVSRAVGPWREAVRAETQRAVQAHHFERESWLRNPELPVAAAIIFYLHRPRTLPKRVRWPVRRPDLDKLTRAVLDGIVAGGAISDDSRIVHLVVTKLFADEIDRPGCEIDLYLPMDREDAQ